MNKELTIFKNILFKKNYLYIFNFMERTNTVHISEIIAKLFDNPKFAKEYKKAKILNSWEKILGKQVANSTKDLYIKNRILYVHFSSSIVRNEISMMKQAIIEKLNNIVNEKIIIDIILR